MNHITFLQWKYVKNKQFHLCCYSGNQPAKYIDLSWKKQTGYPEGIGELDLTSDTSSNSESQMEVWKLNNNYNQ